MPDDMYVYYGDTEGGLCQGACRPQWFLLRPTQSARPPSHLRGHASHEETVFNVTGRDIELFKRLPLETVIEPVPLAWEATIELQSAKLLAHFNITISKYERRDRVCKSVPTGTWNARYFVSLQGSSDDRSARIQQDHKIKVKVKVEVSIIAVSGARAALPTLHNYSESLCLVYNCRQKDTRQKRLPLVSRFYAITALVLGTQQVT